MNKLLSFLNNMDVRAQRTTWVSLALFVVVATMIVLGKTGALGLVSEDVERFLTGLREGPWGLPAVILVFCVSAYVAAPQFVLIGACVVAFGPLYGFLYAWAGTCFSGVVTFYTGRWAGSSMLRRYCVDTANRLSRFIGRNDFLASLIVRNVPTAPFIVVNMAFGALRANYLAFLGGMAIGSLPKILLVTFAGQSLISAITGSPLIAAALNSLPGATIVDVIDEDPDNSGNPADADNVIDLSARRQA